MLALVFLQPIFVNIHDLGIGDWDAYCTFDEVPRITLLKYVQFPFWNPFANGGRPLFAHPHSTFLRPTFVFSLIFGCVIGLKIEMLFMLFFGMMGAFLLSKHYKLQSISGILMSAIFGLTSYFALHITEGHADFVQLAFLPYVFLFFLKSLEEPKYIFLSAIFLALTILGAAPNHSFIFIILFIGMFGSFFSIKKRSLKPLLFVLLLVVFTACLSSIKLFPTYEYLQSHPRFTDTSKETTPLVGIYHVLASFNQQRTGNRFSDQQHRWHEYGAYVGVMPLVLFILGVFVFWRAEWPLILTGIMALLLSLGSFAKFAPWTLLHSMPFLNWMRVSSRSIILFVFVISIISGIVSHNLLVTLKNRKLHSLIIYVGIILIILSLIMVGRQSLSSAFKQVPVSVSLYPAFAQFRDNEISIRDAYSDTYLNVIANKGTLNAYDPILNSVFAKSIDDPNYVAEVYLENRQPANYTYWSPNKLIVNFQTYEDTRVIINQNYDPGWSVRGKQTENFSGLLAVKVNQTETEVELSYFPNSFLIGGVISAVSLIGFLITYFYLRKPE
jgi:hypothetical protein